MEVGTQIEGTGVGTTRSKPVILHLGQNGTLLSIRSKILARTGYPVECSSDLGSVDALLDRYTHGLLVLCHPLTPSERAQLLQKVQGRRPDFSGLLVAKDSTAPASPEDRGLTTISIYQGPRALVMKADELLSRQ